MLSTFWLSTFFTSRLTSRFTSRVGEAVLREFDEELAEGEAVLREGVAVPRVVEEDELEEVELEPVDELLVEGVATPRLVALGFEELRLGVVDGAAPLLPVVPCGVATLRVVVLAGFAVLPAGVAVLRVLVVVAGRAVEVPCGAPEGTVRAGVAVDTCGRSTPGVHLVVGIGAGSVRRRM